MSLINANSMTIPLADKSVQMVATSPPYWGLRDYGTAKWEGGDPECKHLVGNQVQDNKWDGAITSGVRPGCDSSLCKLCGALRIDKQLGLEKLHDCLGWATGNPCGECYVCHTVAWAREVKRVLRDDGVFFLNLGDSYNGSGGAGGDYSPGGLKEGQPKYSGRNVASLKPKDLVGIPWRVALALQADGWYLRSDIIWAKPNPMPESVTDRPTKAHEYVFLLTKSQRYYWDQDAVREVATGYDGRKDTKYKGGNKDMAGGAHERWHYKNLQEDGQQPNTMHLKRLVGEEYMLPVRNLRSVWHIATQSYKGAHFATWPEKLVEPMIRAGSKVGDIILDPFAGSGTTGKVAIKLRRRFIGLELNPAYIELARVRMSKVQVDMGV